MNWIKMNNEAIKLCKNYGLNITKAGLIWAGKKDNFIKKDNDDYHWLFDLDKLILFIQKSIEDPPKGWVSILDASNITGFSIAKIYRMIKNNKLKSETYGRNRNNYVMLEEINNMMEDIMENVTDDMIKLKDIPKEYKVSITKVYYHINKKGLDPIKVKGESSLYVKREQVDKLFRKRTEK